MSIFRAWKEKLFAFLFVLLLAGLAYYHWWGKYVYLVTAYCNCPICINVPEFFDGKFASGKKVYWGGIAADPSVHFGTNIEFVPFWPNDFFAIQKILRNRKEFKVEDRGGMIKGRHLDVFIPDFLGGHAAAKRWGRHWMRIKMNGKLAD